MGGDSGKGGTGFAPLAARRETRKDGRGRSALHFKRAGIRKEPLTLVAPHGMRVCAGSAAGTDVGR